MEKILPMVLTATLGLAGLTGIFQAQQKPSKDEIDIAENKVAVEENNKQGDLDSLEKNVDNMLKLLDDLQKDDPITNNKTTRKKMDGMKAVTPPGIPAAPDRNPDPLPPLDNKAPTNQIESPNEVVKFVPEDPESHFKLGLDYWQSKNLDAAIQHFEEVVRLEPVNAHAYWNLSLLFEEKDMGTEALIYTKKAENIYKKFDYTLYESQAQKRIEQLSKKYEKSQ